MKLALKMTGCKNNRYELDQVILWCAKNNAEIVTDETKADFCVINTCTVTHVADKKSRQLVRKTKNQNPKLLTIVFGCAARMQREAFEEIDEIDYLVSDLKGVLELLEEISPTHTEGAIGQSRLHDGVGDNHSRSRALVQIQDGCDNYCAYCIIAAARGKSKNRPIEDIADEIKQQVKNGYNEVVLTGINIGAYGCNVTTKPDESKLTELIEAVLSKTDIKRIRLSSMGPEYFYQDTEHPTSLSLRWAGRTQNTALFDVLKNPRICRHIHLSVQSGSDSVLKRMRRNYTVKQMDDVIERLKKEIPGIAITTDIIVGFADEPDEERI